MYIIELSLLSRFIVDDSQKLCYECALFLVDILGNFIDI